MSGLSGRGRSSVLRPLLITAVLLLCFSGVVLAQLRAGHYAPDRGEDELLYLPNEKLLTHLTAGMDSIIANFLWIQCIQYTAVEAKGSRNFTWLQHMVNTVVRLDPYFVDAYRYGAMFLSALKSDSDAGLELLERGMVENPRAWELPYEAAMIFLLNRRDQPDAKRQAAVYLAMSSATGNAPALVTDIAAKLATEEDLGEIERDMWIRLLDAPDELLRDLAVRKLEELKIREAVKMLNQGVALFREHTGRPPASITEMLETGLLRAVPPAPLGGRYFIDHEGNAQNTTLLEDAKQTHLNLLRRAIERYTADYGAPPAALEDLPPAGYLRELPPHPYPGEDWRYTPATGALE